MLAPDGALAELSSLVDKSLVMREDAGGLACYRLHETMREFAGLKLREAGEADAVELRCAEYYRSACQRSALEGRYRLLDWLAWADLEIDNVRAVLQRCVTRGDAACGAELAVCLGWFWITRATTEGIRWLDTFLAFPDRGNTQARGWAYFMRGFLAVLKADPAGARPALRAAVTVARETGQRELLSEALPMASIAENMAGEHAAAVRLIDEAGAAARSVAHYRPGAVAVLQARALNGFFAGDMAAVRDAAAAGARRARETGDHYALGIMLLNLGAAALTTGDLDESAPLLAEALRLAHQIDDRVAQFYLLDAFGCHAALAGRARRAAQLLGAADTVRAEAGANVMPFLAPLLARARESAAAALGAAKFQAAFEAGQRLDRDAGLRLALGGPARAGRRRGARARPAPGTGISAARGWRAARDAGGRCRAAGRRRADQQADRGAPVHLRAHRGQPRPQHPEQARGRLTCPDRRLGSHTRRVTGRRAAPAGGAACCSISIPAARMGGPLIVGHAGEW